LEDFVNRNIVRASTTKRAQSRRKQLEKMDRLEAPTRDEKSAHFAFKVAKSSGDIVLTASDLAVGYDNETLCYPVNIDERKFDAMAIVGPNGIGKSTLIKTLVGRLPAIKGDIRLGANVTIGYYDQEQRDLTNSNTVLEELWSQHRTTPELEIRSRLGAFLFSGDDVAKTVGMLSGGERARLLLAKLSMEEDNFLILDEPTNHLDIDSREVLENALVDFEGSLLFVSHDRYFINRIATKVLELSPEGSKLYLGDYDYYLEKKAEEEELARIAAEEAAAKQPQVVVSTPNDYQQSKEQQREARKVAREIERLENRMDEIDAAINKLHEEMTQTQDFVELGKLNETLQELETEQMEVMEQWETLNT
jgi:ATP-binding cassette subfamily F protein 3